MYPAPPVTRTVPLFSSACPSAVASAEVGRRIPRSVAANGVIGETLLFHLFRSEEIAAVEYDRRFHQRLHPTEIRATELVPLGHDGEAVGVLQRVVIGREVFHLAVENPLRGLSRLRIVRLYFGAGGGE